MRGYRAAVVTWCCENSGQKHRKGEGWVLRSGDAEQLQTRWDDRDHSIADLTGEMDSNAPGQATCLPLLLTGARLGADTTE